MRLFLASGAIYVTGAIGLELPGGKFYEAGGIASFGHSMTSTFEEVLELIGIALFIYALLSYMSRQFRPLRIAISD
jgi:hypothetical protein